MTNYLSRFTFAKLVEMRNEARKLDTRNAWGLRFEIIREMIRRYDKKNHRWAY